MTDERQSGFVFGAWLKETDPASPDAGHSTRQVMDQVPQIRQRGRWWPLPSLQGPFTPEPGFPETILTPESVPSTSGPVPARGFTMFSTVKFVAVAAIVALFGGFLLTGALTTQQGDELVPAAVTASPSPATAYVAPQPVSGKFNYGRKFQAHVVTQGEDRKTHRGGGLEMPIELDDARLSGTIYLALNEDLIGEKYQHHDGEVSTGTLELVNDDGSWIGTVRGFTSMNPATQHWHMDLTGTGAHEGLSALLEAKGPYGSGDVEGLIFPGVLPEYPEPVEVPAE